ncbi:hypothetical protein [Mucilaginibacter defluvii]|uniref:DUF3945 domain-containing protein n=1 Tax=Mucilaginibacter defluvii TaxID=1196019 RepID=A0ABP9FN17_9SPHI|nr:hypothetical protein [Bacteroidota bacterium]
MELKHRDQVAEFLQKAADQNWNWVAFDRGKDDPAFHGYASAGEAEAFCTAANNVFDYGEQNFIDADHVFLPVPNLAASLEQQSSLQAPDLHEVRKQFNELSISLQPGWQMNDLGSYLQQEIFFPVQWQQVIEPEKEVTRFLVIEHTHPGHQIYEIGHEVSVLKYFESQEEGKSFLLSEGKELSANKRSADLILAGEYRGRILKLDMEGYPEEYCGITLLTLHCDKNGNVRLSTPGQLGRPLTIEQTLYAKFDADRGAIRLYDDQLKQTDPKLLSASTHASYFTKEVLTIKKSNTMNQKSFDYNKDQLFNLGFGTEIAKELHTKMDQNLTEFTLPHVRKFGKDEVHSTLHFSKGDDAQKDLTFFNRFDATLKKEGREDLTQSFFVGQKHNYTLQERYNMLDGRAVLRPQPVMVESESSTGRKMVPSPGGETYQSWRALDFKNADHNGNFNSKVIKWNDHGKELERYPIAGIGEKYLQDRLAKQLEKGNKVEVTLVKDGQETKANLVANAAMMRLDFFDENGQKLDVKKVNRQAFEQSQQNDLSPQEVQRQAIARAAEQKAQNNGQANDQQQGNKENQSQNNAVKQDQAPNQEQSQGNRRRQGARI